jgi:hypothetical protein
LSIDVDWGAIPPEDGGGRGFQMIMEQFLEKGERSGHKTDIDYLKSFFFLTFFVFEQNFRAFVFTI